MTDRPQHYDSIYLVKRVICVTKNKNPIFLSQISLPNIFNPLYRPVNSLLQYSAALAIPACVSSIVSSDFKYTFCKNMEPHFSNAHRTYSGELIQCNQATGNKCMRGGPWCFFLIGSPQNIWHWHRVFYCGPQIFFATPVRLLNPFHWDLRSL